MKRSVVTHHRPAWCRNHRATSRCTAGRVLRRDCGRGGTRVARAPLPRLRLPLPLFQPAQQAGGPHHGHGMPLTPRPQAALVLVPAQRPRGRFVTLCARLPPLGQAGQRFQRSLRRQVAPAIWPRLGRPPGGLLPPQPARVALPSTRHAPTAYRDNLLAPPPCGALPPAHGAPLPAGHGLEPLIRPPQSTGRPMPQPHGEVGPPRHPRGCLPRLQAGQHVRMIPIVGSGHHAAMRPCPRPRLREAHQRHLRCGPQRDLLRHARRLPPLRVVRPRLRPRQPHGHRPGGLGLTVAAGHGNLAVAHLAQGPRILSLHPFQHN
jgi:hypothetical protein